MILPLRDIYKPEFELSSSAVLRSSGDVILVFGRAKGKKSRTMLTLTDQEATKLTGFLMSRNNPR